MIIEQIFRIAVELLLRESTTLDAFDCTSAMVNVNVMHIISYV